MEELEELDSMIMKRQIKAEESKKIEIQRQRNSAKFQKVMMEEKPFRQRLQTLETTTELLEASKSGDIEALERILTAKVNINFADDNGFTALHWAVQSGEVSCVTRLLKETKIEVNRQDQLGWTPLHYASYNAYKEIVTLLILNEKTRADIKTGKGKTALQLAKNKDVEVLIKKFKKKPTPIRRPKKDTFRDNIEQKTEDNRNSLLRADERDRTKTNSLPERILPFAPVPIKRGNTWTPVTMKKIGKELKKQESYIGLKNQQHPSLILDVSVEGESSKTSKEGERPQIKHTSTLISDEATAIPTRRKGRTILFGDESTQPKHRSFDL